MVASTLVNREWEYVNFAILDQSFDIAVYAVVNTTDTSSEGTACRGLGRLMRQMNVMKCVKTQTLQIESECSQHEGGINWIVDFLIILNDCALTIMSKPRLSLSVRKCFLHLLLYISINCNHSNLQFLALLRQVHRGST